MSFLNYRHLPEKNKFFMCKNRYGNVKLKNCKHNAKIIWLPLTNNGHNKGKKP